MEGKKTKEGLNVHSRLLQERGRNKRPTQVLSWPRDFRQDFPETSIRAGERGRRLLRWKMVTLPSGTWNAPLILGCHRSSGGQSLCIFRKTSDLWR